MVANKEELYFKCLDTVNRQIKKYENEMDQIKESMENNDAHTDYDEDDSKGQLLGDFEKYAEYLDNSRKMKEKLDRIDKKHYTEQIDFGSVVETTENYYFISAALGKITLDEGSTVYAISTDAPIYQEMKGKKAGESFKFQDKEQKILNVH
ncbi:transcription elongation factor [Christiangramia sp. SM2212]|uniref:Transcription elongation factor n=1 Tax=Christiangramia sediminicola TaxID=3073267 RepID=A0ABU1EP52_9FLAO|nr:transcription elongation factor [Christiangramia sp. SM2212]MDR5590167.1 transcription elongation factor [Christiangramia sp. SM2212]